MDQGETNPFLEPKLTPKARQAPVCVDRVGVTDSARKAAVVSNTVFNQSPGCCHAVIFIDTYAVVNHRYVATVDG